MKPGQSVDAMTTPTPLFSVVIPLYNQADSIRRTIDSVLRQDCGDFEVVVVDDGSTDGGGEVIASLEDPRICFVTQENQGVSAARNRGVEESHGSIIAFLDADDEWYDDYLITIAALHERFPECNVYATSYCMRDDDGREQSPLMRLFPSLTAPFIFKNYFEAASVSTPPIWTGCVAVRKAAFEQLGGFPVGLASGEDLITWARLYCGFDVAYDPSPKGIYCKGSLSWRHDKRAPESTDFVGQGLVELLKNSQISDHKKVGLRRYIGLWKKIRASHWIALGGNLRALVTIAQSLWYYPWNLKAWLYIPYALLPVVVQNKLIKIVEKNASRGQSRI